MIGLLARYEFIIIIIVDVSMSICELIIRWARATFRGAKTLRTWSDFQKVSARLIQIIQEMQSNHHFCEMTMQLTRERPNVNLDDLPLEAGGQCGSVRIRWNSS